MWFLFWLFRAHFVPKILGKDFFSESGFLGTSRFSFWCQSSSSNRMEIVNKLRTLQILIFYLTIFVIFIKNYICLVIFTPNNYYLTVKFFLSMSFLSPKIEGTINRRPLISATRNICNLRDSSWPFLPHLCLLDSSLWHIRKININSFFIKILHSIQTHNVYWNYKNPLIFIRLAFNLFDHLITLLIYR